MQQYLSIRPCLCAKFQKALIDWKTFKKLYLVFRNEMLKMFACVWPSNFFFIFNETMASLFDYTWVSTILNSIINQTIPSYRASTPFLPSKNLEFRGLSCGVFLEVFSERRSKNVSSSGTATWVTNQMFINFFVEEYIFST